MSLHNEDFIIGVVKTIKNFFDFSVNKNRNYTFFGKGFKAIVFLLAAIMLLYLIAFLLKQF